MAANFVPLLEASALGASHHVLAPVKLDAARDQNSVVLLKKVTFPEAGAEVSDKVRGHLDPATAGKGIVDGDVMAVAATDAAGKSSLIVSFHGDTDGIQSIPVAPASVRPCARAARMFPSTHWRNKRAPRRP